MSQSANNWASADQSKNLTLADADRLGTQLAANLGLQLGSKYVKTTTGEKISEKELRDNQFISPLPVNLYGETALRKHDYPAFAAQQLKERKQAGMPPFGFQALVRADARTQEAAQAFLAAAAAAATGVEAADRVMLYSPVPMSVQRVANVERAQLLVESGSRAALQRFLAGWHPVLQATREKGLLRWAVDVDPLAI